MSKAIAQLKAALNGALSVYARLLELSEQKKKLLLERFSTDLMAIVAEEEKCVAHLQELDNQRLEALESLTGKANLTLDDALACIDDADLKSDLWILGGKLKEAVQRIQEINLKNQKLLEQALELTQYTIQLITSAPKQVTYKPPGEDKKRPAISALLDRKA